MVYVSPVDFSGSESCFRKLGKEFDRCNELCWGHLYHDGANAICSNLIFLADWIYEMRSIVVFHCFYYHFPPLVMFFRLKFSASNLSQEVPSYLPVHHVLLWQSPYRTPLYLTIYLSFLTSAFQTIIILESYFRLFVSNNHVIWNFFFTLLLEHSFLAYRFQNFISTVRDCLLASCLHVSKT